MRILLFLLAIPLSAQLERHQITVIPNPKPAAGATEGYIAFRETVPNGTNEVRFRVHANIASTITFNLPVADGTAGQCLGTDGSLGLGWYACAGSSTHNLLSATHPDTDGAGAEMIGDLIRRGNTDWERLPIGTANYALKAISGEPQWGQVAAAELSNGVTGTGSVVLYDTPTITTPKIAQIKDVTHGEVSFGVANVAGAFGAGNYINVYYGQSGSPALISVYGADTNADIQVRGRGTGDVDLGAATDIKVSGGTTGQCVQSDGSGKLQFGTCAPAHSLLSTTHGDTTADTAIDGDILIAQGTPATWKRLAFSANSLLTTGATGVPAWSGLKLDSAPQINGYLKYTNGGTGMITATDDNVLVGSGTGWVSTAIGDCDDTVGKHLNYDTTTNAFSCGTSIPYAVAQAAATASALVQRDSNGAIYNSMDSETEALFIENHSAGTGSRAGIFARSSRGSYASPSALSADDRIGVLMFAYYDGDTYNNSASVEAHARGTIGTSSSPSSLSFYTTPNTGTAVTRSERLRINPDGSLSWVTAFTHGTLPTGANGDMLYCSDCTIASPCGSGGSGAIAKKLNGGWVCN